MDEVSRLRRDARHAFLCAVDAVQPTHLLPRALAALEMNLAAAGRVVIATIGKAAPGMALAWKRAAARRPDDFIVVAPDGVAIDDEVVAAAEVFRAAHPTPDDRGIRATRRLLHFAEELGPADLLVVLLSGGASSLLSLPADDIGLADLRTTVDRLLTAGASIHELNAVRRQVQAATGGGLARAAFPARVLTVILSDVVHGCVADIGSGPTVPSPTTAAEALDVLRKFEGDLPFPRDIETFLMNRVEPAGQWPGQSDHESLVMLGDNSTAVEAAAASIRQLGYRTLMLNRPLGGEAARRGRQLGALLRAMRSAEPVALVAGGETTVTVRGKGRGGRNTELALAASLEIAGGEPCAVLAAGTDGIDGSSRHAGGLVDPTTVARMRAADIDPGSALADNDSATALEAGGDALTTGPTGTNVADLFIALK